MNPRPTRCRDVLFAGFLVAGCPAESPPDGTTPGPSARATPTLPVPPDPPESPPPRPKLPLDKAPNKLSFNAKGGTNLGFKINGLAEVYALEGELEIPTWSPPGEGEVGLLRDDDLSTAWRCASTEESRCGVGIHFPQLATVTAVRIYGATGPTRRDFERHPRPRTVRVHTALGYLDANLLDTPEFHYAILGKPIETQNLSLEVLEAFGPTKEPLAIAEFEVYGSRGTARPPLEIEPQSTFVVYETSPWSRRAEYFTALDAMVYRLSEDGTPRPFAPGTALLGQAGDRFALLEDLESATCDAAHGTHSLLDRKTRVLAPLGELGGPGGDAFRRRDGEGLALGYTDEYMTILNGVVLDGKQYVRRHTPVRADKRRDDTFDAWGMESAALRRGGVPLRDAPPDCAVPSKDDLAAVVQRMGKRQRNASELAVEQWRACKVGDHRLFVSDHGPCGSRWELTLVDAAHTIVARHEGRHPEADVRLSQVRDDRWLVEVSDASDLVQVFDVQPSGLTLLAPASALAGRPPAACRKACAPNFPNPNAPKWK